MKSASPCLFVRNVLKEQIHSEAAVLATPRCSAEQRQSCNKRVSQSWHSPGHALPHVLSSQPPWEALEISARCRARLV